MTVQVGILYSDLSKTWVAIDDLASLTRLDGVLTITLTSERGNRRALVERMWSWQNNDRVAQKDLPWWGEDNYALAVMPDGTFLMDQWADEDANMLKHSVDDGAILGRETRPSQFPPTATVTTFRGAYLPPEEWEAAVAVFEAEMF